MASASSAPRSPAAAPKEGRGYTLGRVGEVVVVRMHHEPSPAGLASLAADVTRARDEAGVELVYLGVIPPEARHVRSEIRPLLAEFSRYISDHCSAVHLVIEADGFAGTILRSAITAVAMVTRERKLSVHGTVSDAIAQIASARMPDELARIERFARGTTPPG